MKEESALSGVSATVYDLRSSREALAASELLSISLRVGSPSSAGRLPEAWSETHDSTVGRGRQRLTLLFEALVTLLTGQMPVSEVARVVGGEDTRLWRLIQRLVEAAHAAGGLECGAGAVTPRSFWTWIRVRCSFLAKGVTARP